MNLFNNLVILSFFSYSEQFLFFIVIICILFAFSFIRLLNIIFFVILCYYLLLSINYRYYIDYIISPHSPH